MQQTYSSKQSAVEALSSMLPIRDLGLPHAPKMLIRDLSTQCIKDIQDGYMIDFSSCKSIGSKNSYYGVAGAVVLARFVALHIHALEHIDLSGSIQGCGLAAPLRLSSQAALAKITSALSGHPKITHVDLSNTPTGPESLSDLEGFIDSTPSLRSLSLDNTLLCGNEIDLIRTRIDSKRVRRCQPGINAVVQKNTAELYLSTSALNNLLTRVCVNLDGNQNLSVSVPRHSKFKFEFCPPPGLRAHLSDPQLISKLADVMGGLPAVSTSLDERFPPVSVSSSLQREVLRELREKLNIGPSIEDEEAIHVAKIQQKQKLDILRFAAASLHKAVFRDGDLVVEAGDSPLWVFFLEEPGSSFVVSKGGEVVSTLVNGTIVGDFELLHAFRGVRQYDIHLQSPSGRDVVVWQLHKELFSRLFLTPLLERRRSLRSFADCVKALGTMPPVSRYAICDVVKPLVFDVGFLFDEVCRREDGMRERFADHTRPSFPLLQRPDLEKYVIFVDEGKVALRRGISELREYGRGDVVFVTKYVDQDTSLPSTAGMVLVSSPTIQNHVRLYVMDVADLDLLPVEVATSIRAQASSFKVTR